jgi:antitoxin ParD1/3/4
MAMARNGKNRGCRTATKAALSAVFQNGARTQPRGEIIRQLCDVHGLAASTAYAALSPQGRLREPSREADGVIAWNTFPEMPWTSVPATGQYLPIFGRKRSFMAVMANTTLNVSLTGDLAETVAREVKSGDYSSASEVIREALRDWKKRRIEADVAALEKAHAGAWERDTTPAEEAMILEARREARAELKAKRKAGSK